MQLSDLTRRVCVRKASNGDILNSICHSVDWRCIRRRNYILYDAPCTRSFTKVGRAQTVACARIERVFMASRRGSFWVIWPRTFTISAFCIPSQVILGFYCFARQAGACSRAVVSPGHASFVFGWSCLTCRGGCLHRGPRVGMEWLEWNNSMHRLPSHGQIDWRYIRRCKCILYDTPGSVLGVIQR